ncbi:MAG: hypothetical protein JXJ17_04780 [Anaerolineae bacterium]|nr:hypothetical protein [Anaerolineae bacterium]
MTNLSAIKRAVKLIKTADGKEVVQIPLAEWQALLAMVPVEMGALDDWETSDQWLDTFRTALDKQREEMGPTIEGD